MRLGPALDAALAESVRAVPRSRSRGGGATGVFLQVTCDDAADLPIPGRGYTFGVVQAAQALGDLQILAARGRRALRVHLGSDVTAGLERLTNMVQAALAVRGESPASHRDPS